MHERRASGISRLDIKLEMNTPLPARDHVMGNVRNKAQLIQLLSTCTSESNVRLIGEANCTFGHEEADVNMISYALLMIKEHGKKHVQIVSDDTDVFVLLLFFYWKLRPSARISMKKFAGSIIDINATALKLGDKCF